MNQHAKAMLRHLQASEPNEDAILDEIITGKKAKPPEPVLNLQEERDMMLADKLYIVYEILQEMEKELPLNTPQSASTRIYFSGLEDIGEVITALVPDYFARISTGD